MDLIEQVALTLRQAGQLPDDILRILMRFVLKTRKNLYAVGSRSYPNNRGRMLTDRTDTSDNLLWTNIPPDSWYGTLRHRGNNRIRELGYMPVDGRRDGFYRPGSTGWDGFYGLNELFQGRMWFRKYGNESGPWNA